MCAGYTSVLPDEIGAVMSASEMSSPKVRSEEVSVKPKITKATVGDWPASSDNSSDPIATIPTCQSAINVPVTKPAIAADTNSAPTEECRRTRSKPEPRGRRTLTCTTCRFTCSNTQEFTQHQNTAHTASTNHDVPARRFSTRQKRISSNTENDTKNHSKTTLKKSEANETQKNQSLGVKNHSPPPRNSDSAVANCGDSINKIENCETSGPGAENCDQLDTDTSRQDLKPAADIENAESGKIQSPTSDSSQLDTATMLSTNGPVPQDLGSMSGTSEDENDKSEEGGRLVIDDSSISGSNSSIATPTRCGNIQNRTYICKYCDFTTNSAQQSLYHKKQEHACTLRIYSCNLCDYATEYKQKLPRHHRLHFQGTLPIDDANQVESMEAQSISSPVAPLASAPTTNSGTISASYSTPTSSTPPLSMGSKRSAEEAELDVPQYVQPEDGDEEDGDDDELGESDTAPAEGVEDEEQSLAAAVMPPLKKKRKDVSPDKYFEVAEEVASTKYGCAKCGNVYKWKKSLNKHWKEKHGSDPGDNQYTPPGMMILLQQNNHVQTEHRRCCHKTLLERITVKSGDSTSHSSSRTHTPQNFLNGHYNTASLHHSQEDDVDGVEPASYFPSSIPVGPFVLGTSSQPVFPNSSQRQSLINSLNAPIPSSNVLDLSGHNLDETDSVDEASRPLDFSVQKSSRQTTTVNSQDMPTEEDVEVSALNQLAASNDQQGNKTILECPKCHEVLKTQTAYSHHMAMHLQSANKKVAKCGVCQIHFPNNDALNDHFISKHFSLLTSYKEAVQKIPHGLQQTYHLLKMPLDSISKLTSQEVENPLKCNMCDFTAKWPAELQKHAASHSDERPFVCMVCGSTYKWKWDLVKHFEKAHPTMPNPYKRRDAGGANNTQQGNGELPDLNISTSQSDYEMEEGEISASDSKENAHDQSAITDHSGSFLFDQTPSHDDISVENILRTSHEASLMLSRQPNFLDSPENLQPSSASTSPYPEGQGDHVRSSGITSPQRLALSASFDMQREDVSRPVRANLAKSIKGRPKEMAVSYPISRCKGGSKGAKSPYKGYRTVEGSESSDLKYQCLLCEYKARWPSEIMQHMKNHSSEKPYGCPNCTYKSKWKWDVVKHLKRCGSGGTIKDVIDFTQKVTSRDAPPNVMVTPEGSVIQSQMAASPSATSSNIEDSPTSIQKIGGIAPENQSLLQTSSFMSSVPSITAIPTNLNTITAQAYAKLFYQQMQATKDSGGPPSTAIPAVAAQLSSLAQTEQSGGLQAVTYNSVINEGQHHCLQCTFSASSLAELRRHQVVHSDEKPFMCSDCSYSTKWKCDMKKHKEKYNHHGPIRCARSGDVKDSEKNELKKCRQCTFETYSQENLQNHMNTEHPTSSNKKAHGNKFRCKECVFSSNELVDFIKHRQLHQGQKNEESCQSPSVSGTPEQDEARLKHPRKAVKKYTCSQCNIIFLKYSELLTHQKQAHGPHGCPFCPQRFENKDSLLLHVITHPQFKTEEWESYFMESSDNEEDVNNNTDASSGRRDVGGKNNVSHMDTGSSANTIDLTASQNTPSPTLNTSQVSSQNLPCEWCGASFGNIVRLYKHVRTVHPNQMRQQEIAEGINLTSSPDKHSADPYIKRKNQHVSSFKGDNKLASPLGTDSFSPTPTKPNDKMSMMPSMSTNLGLSLLNVPTLIAQLGQLQGTAASAQALSASAVDSDTGLNLSVRKPEVGQHRQQTFQCVSCPYKTTNFAEYHNHVLMHMASTNLAQQRGGIVGLQQQQPDRPSEGKKDFGCKLCGEKHKSFLELYQHVQDRHPKESREQQEELMQNLVKEVHGLQRMEFGATQTVKGATASSTAVQSESPHEQQTANGGKNPKWLRHKKVVTFKGTPLEALRESNDTGMMWYKCILCNLMDRSPDQVRKHTLQTHQNLPDKYQCGHCGRSARKFQSILQHHQNSHFDLQPDVTVLHYDEISPSPRQPVHQSASTFRSRSRSPVVSLDTANHGKKPQWAMSAVQAGTIKQEMECSMSSPPASPQQLHAADPAPLDLTTDTAEDHPCSKDISAAVGTTEDNPVEMNTPNKKPVPRVSHPNKGKSEAHEIMEAEAADSSARVQTTEVAVAEETLPVFECKHCPYTTQSSYEYRTHCSCHGRKGRYECDYCTFSHQQLAALTQHRFLHKDQPGFNPIYVPKHSEEMTPKTGEEEASCSSSQPKPDIFQCPDCPYRTSSSSSFNVHISMHGQRRQYVCDFCDWSYDRLVILLQHRNVHSADPDFDPSPDDSVFANPEYGKSQSGEFESKLLDSNSQDEPVPSTTDAQSPSFKLSLTKKQYACTNCPYVATSRAAYDFHQSLHGGSGCYPCEQCTYRTERWSLLCQHSRLHEEDKKSRATRLSQADPVPPPPAKEASSEDTNEPCSSPVSKEDSSLIPPKLDEEDCKDRPASENTSA